MNQGQQSEVLLAARNYANTHSLQVAKEAFMALGEMRPSEVVMLFEDERIRRRVKAVAWCLEHSNSPEEFEEKASEILSACKRGESPIPEGY